MSAWAHLRRVRLYVMIAGGMLLVAGGAVAATIAADAYTDSSGQYHGCVNVHSGVLRVVQPTDSCRTGESAIAWNQQGPPGPGATFVSRSQTVDDTYAAPGAFSVTVHCQTGEQPVAGGGWGHSDLLGADGYLIGSRPTTDGWEARFNEPSGHFVAQAFVTCAGGS